MKNSFLIMLFIFTASILFTPSMAQTTPVNEVENAVKANGKYAILVSNTRYLQAAVNTGSSLKTTKPNISFEVVLIGPVVKELAQNPDLKATIQASKSAGIRLVVCETAMHHFNLQPSDYNAHIEFTPDGFIYLFGLQETGFKTITL
ncbi:DsrE family protein [Bizionia sediminis]|uniref:DsrE family protein n=1 Tax=Bizionia sediminis TaxID=1737064 RepID=A0ABW5KUY6_9FLAO